MVKRDPLWAYYAILLAAGVIGLLLWGYRRSEVDAETRAADALERIADVLERTEE